MVYGIFLISAGRRDLEGEFGRQKRRARLAPGMVGTKWNKAIGQEERRVK